MTKRQRLIRASEVGEYVFCARAWRLRLEGFTPVQKGDRLEAGTTWHLRHGRSVRRARALRQLAILSALFALVLLAAILLFWRR